MASRSSVNPPEHGRITVTKNGRTYEAPWGVERGVLTVWHPELGRKSTQSGGGPRAAEEAIARMLLTELVIPD